MSNCGWLTIYTEINKSRLEPQLKLFCDFVKSAAVKHMPGLKEVTSIATLTTLMAAEKNMVTTTFSEINKLVRIFLSSPATSATAERSFSGLRRLKSYLRSTTTQKRLNHMLILHTHKHRTSSINMQLVAKQFISSNPRRSDFFGTV